MGLYSFLLGFCFWSCLLLGYCMFLFLFKLERWRQRKCFVELARLIILLGFVGLAQFVAWLSHFFVWAAVGESSCWAPGAWRSFVWLAFAVHCFSGGGEIVVVKPVVLICLFRVGLAHFFAAFWL